MKIQQGHLVAAVVAFCGGLLVASLMCTHYALTVANLFDPKYAVIWSGVFGATIAAVISLAGVAAANKSSLERLDKQHQHDAAETAAQRGHDAAQNDEDRKAAIRREVYTTAVDEVHAALAAIGGMPERQLSKRSEDGDGLQQFLKANAKVWLVAESEAAHLSRELTSLMSELYLTALQGAFPIRVAMEPVRELERRIVHAEAEIRRIEAKLAEQREERSSFELRDAAAAALKEASDWMGTLTAERDRQVALIRPSRMKLATELFEEMRPVQKMIVRLVSSLRKELSLPPDEAQFLAQLADMERRATAALSRAYGEVAPKA